MALGYSGFGVFGVFCRWVIAIAVVGCYCCLSVVRAGLRLLCY